MTDINQASHLDPKWINLDVLHIWINQCTYGHDKCMNPLYDGGRPDLLIDVVDLKLVRSQDLSNDIRYFALSYVWGGAKTSELNKSTLEPYKIPRAFVAENRDIFIPKTIRQSMQLVALLGERYLWIRIMASIYHQAHVTIVAAAGWDCDAGFRGIKDISPPRNLAPNYADDLGKYLDMSNFIWDSRGWTYQERAFSRRLLIFADQIVTWECATIDAHEGNISGAPGLADVWGRRPNYFLSMKSHIPETVGSFLNLVSIYNTRSLTHSSDGYRAFSSFLGALTQVATEVDFMWRGDIWGLPVAEFDEALLWYPVEQTMSRRSSSLPSWSWVGWQGHLTSMTQNWVCKILYDDNLWKQMTEQSTLPLCTWYISPFEDHAMAEAHIAVTDITRQSIGTIINPSSLLRTRAETGYFKIEETAGDWTIMEGISAAMAYIIGPRSEEQTVGLLILHDWESFQDGGVLELVAISETKSVIRDPLITKVCTLINVIAIEWKDEIAHRVGIGRVDRDQWKLNGTLVSKDIILG